MLADFVLVDSDSEVASTLVESSTAVKLVSAPCVVDPVSDGFNFSASCANCVASSCSMAFNTAYLH